jgi:hypothetical protein
MVNIPSSGSMWVITVWPVPTMRRRGTHLPLPSPPFELLETTVLSTAKPRLTTPAIGGFAQFDEDGVSQLAQICATSGARCAQ